MAKDIVVAIQKALYKQLQVLGVPVHDAAPQAKDGGSDAGFPYVVIGAIVPAKWDTARETGFEVAMRIHTWSRSNAMLEAKGLQVKIYEALHRQEFPIDGFTVVLCDRETTSCERSPDRGFHGICTYRCVVAAD